MNNEDEKTVPNAVIVILAYGDKQKEFTLVESTESEKIIGINLSTMMIGYFEKDEKTDFPSLRLGKISNSSDVIFSFHDEHGNCIEPEYVLRLGYGIAVSKNNFHIIAHIKAVRFESTNIDFWNKRIFTNETAAKSLIRLNRQQIALGINDNSQTIAVSKDSSISPGGGHTTDIELIVDFIQDKYVTIIVDQIKKEEGIIQLRNSLNNEKTILKKGESMTFGTLENNPTEITFIDFFPTCTLHEWDL